MSIFNKKTKKVALICVGPLGCYVAYQILFIGRYLDIEKYPLLTSAYFNGAAIVDMICASLVAVLGVVVGRRFGACDEFSPTRKPLSTLTLMLILIGIISLMALNIYSVLGTLSPANILLEYHTYNFKATDGGAWMILAMYAALFLQLMDMYFGGVTKRNGVFLMLSILIVSFSGGRGILILFVLMFIVMLMYQRIGLVKFLMASGLAIASVGTSFFLITDMRAPTDYAEVASHEAPVPGGAANAGAEAEAEAENMNEARVAPTDSYEDLNYNAAFISEDVLLAIKNHDIEPRAYAAEDALVAFVPRRLMPNKPISTAETRAIYPDVAKRGTNITFPLKANLLMHLGHWAFYADWIVVAICQTLMFIGISRRTRTPSISSFTLLFSGIAFTLIARGGIFNARLLVIVLCIFAGYVGYCRLLSIQNGWFFRGGRSMSRPI
ncbi:hypothetical protein [Pseudomonas sp. S2_C03]